MIENIIFSHDGNLDDLICLIVLLSAHKKGTINLKAVILTPADSFLEPAIFATRKILDIMNVSNIIVGICNISGKNPFPDEWRAFPYSVCHMPFMLRGGEPKYEVSTKNGENIISDLVNILDGVVLIETGPLTCIANSLKFIDKEQKNKIQKLVWMGGAIDVAGSIETFTKHDGTAEWNSYWDPQSTKDVFDSGIPIIMCPLDTTNSVPITTDFLRRLADNTNGSMLGDMIVHIYSIICRTFGTQNYYAWDILTVSYLLNPNIFEIKKAKISICNEGQSQGRTYRDENGNDVQYLSNVNVSEWEKLLCKYLINI
jgi:purine nucleosidase